MCGLLAQQRPGQLRMDRTNLVRARQLYVPACGCVGMCVCVCAFPAACALPNDRLSDTGE